jgi:putative heme iron utilization protein
MPNPFTPEISDRICKHMNEDHADAVLLYAKVFANTTEATSAKMLKIDAHGMELMVQNQNESTPVRIAFDHELQDAEDAHHTLIDMVKQARQQASKA